MEDLKEMGDQFELRLGNREVALLVGAVFLVLVLAFAFGVIMGKRVYGPVQGQPVAQVTAPPAAVPAPATAPPGPEPATAPAPTATSEQYTFYDTLKNQPATGTAAPSHPPAPATAPVAAHAQPAPASTATPPSTVHTPAPASPASSVQHAPKPEPVSEPEPASHTAAQAKTPATAKSPGGAWSIQVSAVPDKKRAEDYMKSLKTKGLEVWLSAIQGTDNVTYYRIRVGRYPSYEEAKTEMDKLKEAKSIPQDSFVRK